MHKTWNFKQQNDFITHLLMNASEQAYKRLPCISESSSSSSSTSEKGTQRDIFIGYMTHSQHLFIVDLNGELGPVYITYFMDK